MMIVDNTRYNAGSLPTEGQIKVVNRQMEINHLSHQHPLKFLEMMIVDNTRCNGCSLPTEGQMYVCQSCKYQLHEFCAELPKKFRNPFHPHPLVLQVSPSGEEMNFKCASCLQFHSGFCYCCDSCDLNLDIKCAVLIPAMDEGFDLLHHFSHFHPLVLCHGFPNNAKCAACWTSWYGPNYACPRCNFFLHQSCSKLKLPLEIQHSDHQCLLTLCSQFLPLPDKCPELYILFELGLATKFQQGLYYHCKKCEFQMKVEPALKLNNLTEDQKQFHHFSHRHPLMLEEQNNDDDQVNCSACGKFCCGPTYGCNTCGFFLHQPCFDLPVEIRLLFHQCPLFLHIKPNYLNCRVCSKIIQGFYFYCEWCNFSMDVDCALSPVVEFQRQEQFSHFSHEHPLTLTEIQDSDGVYCSACLACFSGQAFVCRKCNFVLQKSCFESPREIQHELHPSHCLTLRTRPTKVTSTCKACCKYVSGFTYCCVQCDFDLHVKCTAIMPTISYKGHPHQLFFLENIDIEVMCNSCGISCSSFVFHCVRCNFNLHHICGPLPCTIKHECHIDPIILTDSPCEDDTYQFYCDACEEERDPRLSIYHCKECHFITEIKCVMSEIILTLQGEYGEVELKTPDRGMKGKVISKKLKGTEMEQKEEQSSEKQVLEQENSPVLSLHDMLMSFSEEDKMQVNRVLQVHRRNMIKAKEISSTNHREDIIDNLEVSLFSDGAYKHFIENLDSRCSSLTHRDHNELCAEMLGCLTKSGEDEEFVKLRDILIMENMAPILLDLFDKYGDIRVEYFSSLRVKLYFVVMLCGTVHSMRKTRIIDISENQLLNWLYFLKISQLSGLKVQFVLDHLEKVTRAYFGLQVRKKADNTIADIDREMTDISKEMEELTKKFEALKGKRDRITSAESSKSRFVENCLEEASDIKWWPAGAGLI